MTELTTELKTLEAEIFKGKKERRIQKIRDAWAAYMNTLKPRPWWKFWAGLKHD